MPPHKCDLTILVTLVLFSLAISIISLTSPSKYTFSNHHCFSMHLLQQCFGSRPLFYSKQVDNQSHSTDSSQRPLLSCPSHYDEAIMSSSHSRGRRRWMCSPRPRRHSRDAILKNNSTDDTSVLSDLSSLSGDRHGSRVATRMTQRHPRVLVVNLVERVEI